jgi:hypothetical protein
MTMLLLKVGDLVRAVNHTGVYWIMGFSKDGVIAEIQAYDPSKKKSRGERISVSVVTLRQYKAKK